MLISCQFSLLIKYLILGGIKITLSKLNKKVILKTSYNLFIIIFAILSIVFVILDLLNKINLSTTPYSVIDSTILIIFAFDYFFRFLFADNKFSFFKRNFFDLLAIIPFNAIFSFFRIFRILRFTRLIKLTKLIRLVGLVGKVKNKINKFLHTNGFIYMIYISLCLIITSSILMMFLEKQSFFDALWWSIVTCTTVGYGDISPSTALGRVIAVVLMIFGIGFISMLTGTITTYFSNKINIISIATEATEFMEITKDMSDEQLKKLTVIAKAIKSDIL